VNAIIHRVRQGRGAAREGNHPRTLTQLNALTLLAGLATTLIMSDCGGSASSAKLKSISITPQTLSISLGTSQQFEATGAYNDGSSQDLTTTASWKSSNPAVATISASGLATSVGTGSTTISASIGSQSGMASLAVGPAVSVSVTPGSASIAVSQTQQFTASVANSSNTAVTWSVDGVAGGSTTVGTLSSSGLYQAPVVSGTHQVTATSQQDPTKSAQASVTVAYQGMLTYRNDNGRTGQNLSEVTLTSANVNSTQFGKLVSYPVDGVIYGQPLYVASVTMPDQGAHNVVYVTTEHDSVYAFDADGETSNALWHVSFIDPSAGVTTVSGAEVGNDGFPGGEMGITGTPVIDAVGGTIYMVAYTKENGEYVYRLHALDLVSGAEKFGGPVVIQASVPGTGDENNAQGQVPFDAERQLQRPGLLLLNGVVYIAFGTNNEIRPWHGWLLAYNATTLRQVAAFNTTPNGYGASFWEAGCAPAADASGNIYVAAANGSYDAATGGSDYGESVLKLKSGVLMQAGALSVLDWFIPFNAAYLEEFDYDLGSGGTMLLPDQPGPHPHLLVVAGKEDVGGGKGRIYLLDRDNLGHFNAVSDQVVQELTGAINRLNYTTPAYWQGNIYYASHRDNLKMFALQNGLLSTSPVAMSPETFGYPGASPSVSANGSSNGVVWAIDASTSTGPSNGGPAVLRAYNATDVSYELYDSNQAGARDTLGPAVRFTVPTIIAGKVYVGTGTELDVLGPISQ
jgi:Bacterial Ig-like domain (group 2)